MARIGQTSFRTTRNRHRPTARPSGCKGSKARIPSGPGELSLQYEAGYMTAVLLQSKCHPRSYLLAPTGGSIYDDLWMTPIRDGIIYSHLCAADANLRVDSNCATKRLGPWDPIFSWCAAGGRFGGWWRCAVVGLVVCWAKCIESISYNSLFAGGGLALSW